MKIKILGTGCARCELLEELTRKALVETDVNAEIEVIGDNNEIMKYAPATPGLLIDGKLVYSGELPCYQELKSYILLLSMMRKRVNDDHKDFGNRLSQRRP